MNGKNPIKTLRLECNHSTRVSILGNEIDKEGAVALSKTFQGYISNNFGRLSELRLGRNYFKSKIPDNNIGNDGSAALSDGLKFLHYLTSLDLHCKFKFISSVQ